MLSYNIYLITPVIFDFLKTSEVSNKQVFKYKVNLKTLITEKQRTVKFYRILAFCVYLWLWVFSKVLNGIQCLFCRGWIFFIFF